MFIVSKQEQMNEAVQKRILQVHDQQILREISVYKPHNIPNPTAMNTGKIQREMYHKKCLRMCALPKGNLLWLLSELWS